MLSTNKDTLHIGITACGGGVGQAIIKALRTSSLETRLAATNTHIMGVGIHWADQSYIVPPAAEEAAHIDLPHFSWIFSEICKY